MAVTTALYTIYGGLLSVVWTDFSSSSFFLPAG